MNNYPRIIRSRKKISVIGRDQVSKWERIKINTNHFPVILYGVSFSLFASLFSEIKKKKERKFHRISRAFGRVERRESCSAAVTIITLPLFDRVGTRSLKQRHERVPGSRFMCVYVRATAERKDLFPGLLKRRVYVRAETHNTCGEECANVGGQAEQTRGQKPTEGKHD